MNEFDNQEVPYWVSRKYGYGKCFFIGGAIGGIALLILGMAAFDDQQYAAPVWGLAGFLAYPIMGGVPGAIIGLIVAAIGNASAVSKYEQGQYQLSDYADNRFRSEQRKTWAEGITLALLIAFDIWGISTFINGEAIALAMLFVIPFAIVVTVAVAIIFVEQLEYYRSAKRSHSGNYRSY